MDALILVPPGLEDEEAISMYKQEFAEDNESMDGTSDLAETTSVKEWIRNCEADKQKETVREGLVPATLYLVKRNSDKELVGIVQIRHELNGYLLQFGGHIGYSVKKSQRNKGYGTEILRQTLLHCRELGIKRVLVTCLKSNVASAKIIVSNGGILENEVEQDGKIIERYWIDL